MPDVKRSKAAAAAVSEADIERWAMLFYKDRGELLQDVRARSGANSDEEWMAVCRRFVQRFSKECISVMNKRGVAEDQLDQVMESVARGESFHLIKLFKGNVNSPSNYPRFDFITTSVDAADMTVKRMSSAADYAVSLALDLSLPDNWPPKDAVLSSAPSSVKPKKPTAAAAKRERDRKDEVDIIGGGRKIRLAWAEFKLLHQIVAASKVSIKDAAIAGGVYDKLKALDNPPATTTTTTTAATTVTGQTTETASGSSDSDREDDAGDGDEAQGASPPEDGAGPSSRRNDMAPRDDILPPKKRAVASTERKANEEAAAADVDGSSSGDSSEDEEDGSSSGSDEGEEEADVEVVEVDEEEEDDGSSEAASSDEEGNEAEAEVEEGAEAASDEEQGEDAEEGEAEQSEGEGEGEEKGEEASNEEGEEGDEEEDAEMADE